VTEEYETLRSEPISLNLAAASGNSQAPPEAGLVPVAEMTDILSVIEPGRSSSSETFSPGAWWHLFPAVLAIILIFLILKRHSPRVLHRDSSKEHLQSELSEIENSSDDVVFIRKAAHFAETKELPHDDFLVALLAERDASCFQPGDADTHLTRDRRGDILKSLRERATRLLVFALVLCALQPLDSMASVAEARQAWDSGEYETALVEYQSVVKEQETPDLLYNIGNCYYRLNEPAQAALSYHRALRLAPQHPEATQNLAFVNRKLGAITAPEPEEAGWVKKLPLSVVVFTFQLAIWLAVLALLARYAFSSSRQRKAAWIVFSGALALSFLAGLAYFFYPASLAKIFTPDALVTQSDAAIIRTEPSSAGSVLVEASPATTCQVITERAPWTYLELPDGSRGWIRSEALTKI
jgi:tetratricopeptide (TPR) repeat protein